MGWVGGDAALKPLMAQAKEEGFTGKASQLVAVYPDSGEPARRVYLAGVGPMQGLHEDSYRRAAGRAGKAAMANRVRGLTVQFPEKGDSGRVRRVAQAIVEGAMLTQYRFTDYMSTNNGDLSRPVEALVLLHGDDVHGTDLENGGKTGEIVAKAVMFARDLVNEPPNHLTPSKLADRARKMGPRIRAKILDAKTIERMGMGGVIGVGRGSHNPPVFIHLHYTGSKPKARVALVGKGVCFDSGGLSLKGSEHMETMKMDMAGAAAVMGVMQAAEALKLPYVIDGYIPAVENMPGGGATKPGDVVKMLNGKTVEILNTDAEGRLILADALVYASKEKPDYLVDIATLTGACVVALGSGVTGVMGKNPDLVKALVAAGEVAGEPLWQLPLVADYRDQLKSRVADMKNIGGRREAGTILGGLFLQEFAGVPSWAHLDIAGTAWAERGHLSGPAGATGAPIRALVTWLSGLSAVTPA
jgi:leucyl aminopeptidase